MKTINNFNLFYQYCQHKLNFYSSILMSSGQLFFSSSTTLKFNSFLFKFHCFLITIKVINVFEKYMLQIKDFLIYFIIYMNIGILNIVFLVSVKVIMFTLEINDRCIICTRYCTLCLCHNLSKCVIKVILYFVTVLSYKL